jgi:phosphopantetheinyl transferase
MPIYHREEINQHLTVLIWKIEESLEYLEKQVIWHPSDKAKYATINHPEKKREFLALRLCLIAYFAQNPEVFYHPNGKPYLDATLARSISFSHTRGFAAMAVSTSLEVGLDLEHYRPAIVKLKNRILRKEEKYVLEAQTEVDHLLYYWGAKECLIKICGNKQLDAQAHLRIAPFMFSENCTTRGIIAFNNLHHSHIIYCKKLGALYLTYAWKEKSY